MKSAVARTARKAAFTIAVPLVAMSIGCGAAHEVHRDAGPDSSADASQDSSADVSVDAEPDGQAHITRERTSEQLMRPDRYVVGYSCAHLGSVSYNGYDIEVQDVRTGPESEGVWAGHEVDVEVYHGSDRVEFTLNALSGNVAILSSEISFTVGYALHAEGHSACAEIGISDRNPEVAQMTETVDFTVSAENHDVVLGERILRIEVTFPNGLWTVREDEGMEEALTDISGFPPALDLGIIEPTFISAVRPDLGMLEFVEGTAQARMAEGNSHTMHDMTVSADEIWADLDTSSMKATVTIDNGERRVTFNDINQLWGILGDQEEREHAFFVFPTAWTAEELAVFVQVSGVTQRLQSGDRITADGSEWSVTVNAGDRQINSFVLERLD